MNWKQGPFDEHFDSELISSLNANADLNANANLTANANN